MPDAGNLFSNLPVDDSKELFQTLHAQPGIKVERILSFGQVTPENEWFEQDSDEWVLMARGKGVLLFEDGSEHTLAEGDYLLIPKHRKHRVIYTDPGTIWLAIHIQ